MAMTATRQITAAPTDPVAARPILVVDDSRAHRSILCKTLGRWGYQTLEADSGEAALGICRGADVDFIISDWMMPGMSGADFCRALRAERGDRPAYFILLTARTDRETLAEGLESGADDFLSKPFNVVELKARIRAGQRVLRSQRDVLAKNALLSDALAELRKVHAAVERDLREARRFQEALVPEPFHRLAGTEISFLYRPSGHVGGDLVGMFRVSDARYGVFSADVSGHGVASALMAARIAGHLNPAAPERNLALSLGETGEYEMLPPDEVCRRLNTVLLGEMETDAYLTMALAEIDLHSGRARIAQAGHPSPAVQRADGRVEFVSSYGMPIGLLPDAEFSSFEASLQPGDRLLLYSDGITECPVPGGGLLDEAGLAAILEPRSHLPGPELMESLVSSLADGLGTEEFGDDLSAVLVERTGPD